MKRHLPLLFSLVLLIAPRSATAAAPTYEELRDHTPLTEIQKAAIDYLLANDDERMWVRGYGVRSLDADEFSGGEKVAAQEKENQEALAFARRFLNGEIDYLAQFQVWLSRYNPANQMFITSLWAPTLRLSVDFRPVGWKMPARCKILSLDELIISGTDAFSGLKVPVEQARQLVEFFRHGPLPATDPNGYSCRVVMLRLLVRIVPGTLVNTPGVGRTRYNAVVRAYSISNSEGLPTLPQGLLDAMRFAPYDRTPADADLAARLGNKVLVSPGLTLVFSADGSIHRYLASIDDCQTPESKLSFLTAENKYTHLVGQWYAVDGQLITLLVGSDVPIQEPYEFDQDGTFRLNNVRFGVEKHIRITPDKIRWVP